MENFYTYYYIFAKSISSSTTQSSRKKKSCSSLVLYKTLLRLLIHVFQNPKVRNLPSENRKLSISTQKLTRVIGWGLTVVLNPDAVLQRVTLVSTLPNHPVLETWRREVSLWYGTLCRVFSLIHIHSHTRTGPESSLILDSFGRPCYYIGRVCSCFCCYCYCYCCGLNTSFEDPRSYATACTCECVRSFTHPLFCSLFLPCTHTHTHACRASKLFKPASLCI